MTCNSVALTPRVPGWSRWKLRYGPPLLEYLVGVVSLDPAFSVQPAADPRRGARPAWSTWPTANAT